MKKGLRRVFLVAIYLSGILIGNVYAPEMVAYAKQTYNDRLIEEKVKKAKPPVKKRYRRTQVA